CGTGPRSPSWPQWSGCRVGLSATPGSRSSPSALYLLSMPLISPLSEQHHLVVLVAPLWCWVWLASDDRTLRRFDLIGGTLFLALSWVAVRRFYVLDFLALAVLYVALLVRAARLGRRATRDASRKPDDDAPPTRRILPTSVA